MSSVIDRAVKHLEEQGRASVEIPEWPDDEGKPTRIWFTSLTVRERNKCYPPNKPVTNSNAVSVVLLKATDENGVRLFLDIDRPKLENSVDSKIISRIFTKIIAGVGKDEDEIKAMSIAFAATGGSAEAWAEYYEDATRSLSSRADESGQAVKN